MTQMDINVKTGCSSCLCVSVQNGFKMILHKGVQNVQNGCSKGLNCGSSKFLEGLEMRNLKMVVRSDSLKSPDEVLLHALDGVKLRRSESRRR